MGVRARPQAQGSAVKCSGGDATTPSLSFFVQLQQHLLLGAAGKKMTQDWLTQRLAPSDGSAPPGGPLSASQRSHVHPQKERHSRQGEGAGPAWGFRGPFEGPRLEARMAEEASQTSS